MKTWQQSGKTQAAYCEQQGLNLKTFAYWRHRLKKADSTTVRLVELPAEAPRQAEGSAIRVVVDEQFAIEIADDFSPATLSHVLEVLRGL